MVGKMQNAENRQRVFCRLILHIYPAKYPLSISRNPHFTHAPLMDLMQMQTRIKLTYLEITWYTHGKLKGSLFTNLATTNQFRTGFDNRIPVLQKVRTLQP